MVYAPVGPALAEVSTLEIDGRIVALTPNREDVVFLNDTASAVWRLADGTRTLQQILDELAHAYDTQADVIAGDVRAVIASFVAGGLMTDPF